MAEKVIPEALSSLVEAVLAYQDTQDGLARVRSVAQSVFGDDWRLRLPSIVQDCPDEMQPQLNALISRALTYEKAAMVWGEVSRMIDPRRQINVDQVKKDFPEMQQSLSIFGKAGTDLLEKLQTRVAEAEANPAAMQLSNAYGLSVDQLWNFDHFMRLKGYYDQTISRTSARCVHLGGLELSQYPYFGYILDLLDEILTYGMEIVTPPYAKIIQDRYKGGEAALKKLLLEFKKEFDDNAPPEMISEEEESMDDIKNRLGSLAENNEPEEDIGPAPDGFESPSVESVPVQTQPLSSAAAAPAQQVQAKAPQKIMVKKVVQVKVPVKRPAPAS